MNKQQLRQLMARNKRGISPSARMELSAPVLRRLATHPRFKQAKTILLFESLDDEVNTHEFIHYWATQKQIILPTVCGDNLELHTYSPTDNLTKGTFGIPESNGPVFTNYASIDLAIVPGVAFDHAGHRLGRGGGYYDRFFARHKKHNIYKIGLCFDFQLMEQIPFEEHDIIMDEII